MAAMYCMLLHIVPWFCQTEFVEQMHIPSYIGFRRLYPTVYTYDNLKTFTFLNSIFISCLLRDRKATFYLPFSTDTTIVSGTIQTVYSIRFKQPAYQMISPPQIFYTPKHLRLDQKCHIHTIRWIYEQLYVSRTMLLR